MDSDSLVYDDKFEGIWLQDSLYMVDLFNNITIADTTVLYFIHAEGDSIDTVSTRNVRYVAKFDEDRNLIMYKFKIKLKRVEIDTFTYYDDDDILSYGVKTRYYNFENEDNFQLKSYPNAAFDRDKYGFFNPIIEFYERKNDSYLEWLFSLTE